MHRPKHRPTGQRLTDAEALGYGLQQLGLSASLNAEPFYRSFGVITLGRDLSSHPSGLQIDRVRREKPRDAAASRNETGRQCRPFLLMSYE